MNYELSDIQAEENKNEPSVVVINPDHPTSNINHGPLDKYHAVFIVLFIHGVGTLMPWNMFINAQDYFRNYKLSPDGVNVSDKIDVDSMRKNFLSYLGIAAQVPNVIFSGVNLLFNMGAGNLRLRVNTTLAIEAFIFLITILLAVIDTPQQMFFYLTIFSVVVLNMVNGIYQNCIYGTGAKFPGMYTNAILIGSNFSGTFTSIVNLVSIWLAPAPQDAAIYYFITALFVILACVISYNLLSYNRYFNYFENMNQSTKSENSQLISVTECESSCRQEDDIPETLRNAVAAMEPRTPDIGDDDATFQGELKNKWKVFLKCWPHCLNVFLVFYVTLALFPSALADVKQVGTDFSDKYFSSFSCFFIFNINAMIGNLVSGWFIWPGKKYLWVAVVARFVFVPFFLLCNFLPEERKWPVVFANDYVFIAGNVLFGLSSGYLSSLSMMFASNNLEANEASKAGMIAAFFLVFGIVLGINSSFILPYIVKI